MSALWIAEAELMAEKFGVFGADEDGVLTPLNEVVLVADLRPCALDCMSVGWCCFGGRDAPFSAFGAGFRLSCLDGDGWGEAS